MHPFSTYTPQQRAALNALMQLTGSIRVKPMEDGAAEVGVYSMSRRTNYRMLGLVAKVSRD